MKGNKREGVGVPLPPFVLFHVFPSLPCTKQFKIMARNYIYIYIYIYIFRQKAGDKQQRKKKLWTF